MSYAAPVRRAPRHRVARPSRRTRTHPSARSTRRNGSRRRRTRRGSPACRRRGHHRRPGSGRLRRSHARAPRSQRRLRGALNRPLVSSPLEFLRGAIELEQACGPSVAGDALDNDLVGRAGGSEETFWSTPAALDARPSLNRSSQARGALRMAPPCRRRTSQSLCARRSPRTEPRCALPWPLEQRTMAVPQRTRHRERRRINVVDVDRRGAVATRAWQTTGGRQDGRAQRVLARDGRQSAGSTTPTNGRFDRAAVPRHGRGRT